MMKKKKKGVQQVTTTRTLHRRDPRFRRYAMTHAEAKPTLYCAAQPPLGV